MPTLLQTPTPNLAQSLHFYQQLNFQLLPNSSTIVTDGKVNIFINPDRFARLGILILAIIKQLKALQVPIIEEITYFNKEGIVDNVIIRDPGGLDFFLFND